MLIFLEGEVMKVNFLRSIMLGSSVFVLTACSLTAGGNTATTGGSVAGGSSVKTLQQLNTANTKIAGYTSRLKTQSGNKVALTEKNSGFSFTANSAGGYDVDTSGQKISFKSSDYVKANDHYVASIGANKATLMFNKDNADYKYANMFAIKFASPTLSSIEYMTGVYGSKTTIVPTSQSASYKGRTEFLVQYKNHFNISAGDAFNADINLSANFATGNITGKIDNIRTQYQPSKVRAETISINDGKVSSTGFAAKVKSTAGTGYFSEVLNGTMNAQFYGPDGAETGGNFDLSSDKLVGTGSFIAKQ